MIDVWRILVIYEFGGLYTDIDNWPGRLMDEDTIQPDDEAFVLSDGWGRPSQWFFAMEPKHPWAYFTMFEIMKRVTELSNIERPKVVFTTGPEALKHGFTHFSRASLASQLAKEGQIMASSLNRQEKLKVIGLIMLKLVWEVDFVTMLHGTRR